MTSRLTCISNLKYLAIVAGLLSSSATNASDNLIDVKLSVGGSWQTSNEVQIPNNSQGTRFDLDKLAGIGPYPAVRFEGIWNINQKHSMRVLLQPLSYSETGSIDKDIQFAGATFTGDQPVTGKYRFNSWRLGYRYHMSTRENWDFWLGLTLKVRDAEIRLEQGNVSSTDDDLGVLPLLHLAGEYRINSRWSLAADLDGLAGGPGRAIDLGIGLQFNVSEQWQVGAEYRTLEGGADIDAVYNFAWFNTALLTTSYGF